MKNICIASNNKHKKEEIKLLLLNANFIVDEKYIFPEVIEDGKTLNENAIKKAEAMFKISNTLSIADDTGLEVYYLNMRPGVYSARYAGENVSYDDNNKKLLEELKGVPIRRRNARFRSVIAIVDNNFKKIVEGVTEGIILESPCGDLGFGYDPLFLPNGFNQTYAEMNLELKNKISHRGKAFLKLLDELNILG